MKRNKLSTTSLAELDGVKYDSESQDEILVKKELEEHASSVESNSSQAGKLVKSGWEINIDKKFEFPEPKNYTKFRFEPIVKEDTQHGKRFPVIVPRLDLSVLR